VGEKQTVGQHPMHLAGGLEAGDARLLRVLGLAPEHVRAVAWLGTGLSGARVGRLTLEAPGAAGGARSSRRVCKRLQAEGGWLGAASRDRELREVRLWTSGVLLALPHALATGMLAAVEQGDAAGEREGALLLRDEAGHLLRDPLRTPPGRLPAMVLALLDRLALLHARFWNDPWLRDPTLGLMPADAALLLTSPASIAQRLAEGDPSPYLTLARQGWEAFFALASPEDASRLRAVLAAPVAYVRAVERLPWTLVHGDVWGPNIGWLPPSRLAPRTGHRLLLLDWALAMAGPATYDPLWLCGTWHALAPERVLAVYRARLTRHLRARGVALPAVVWRGLSDAGYLRTALTCGEALGRTATEAPPGAARRRAEARVRWWARRAALAARRLGLV
jgi:hypothetical protein